MNRIDWRQAFFEATLICLGVLAALTVDSWWDERQERVAEIEYLLSLKYDFQTNEKQLRARIEAERLMIELGKRLHQFVESDDATLPLSTLNEILGGFYNPATWRPVTGTYEEMVGSGRLLFIQNDELRRKLSQYGHALSIVRGIENNSWTNWYFEQSPFIRKHLNLSQFDWFGGYNAYPPFEVDIQGLRSREFHNLISSWMLARSDIAGRYQMVIDAGDDVLDLIDRELDGQ